MYLQLSKKKKAPRSPELYTKETFENNYIFYNESKIHLPNFVVLKIPYGL